ncbi:kinase-like domain-containing protein [Sparassis latifolia]
MLSDPVFFHGLLAELLCYKHVLTRPADRCPFLMEIDAALQDEENVIFAMPLMQCDLIKVIRGRGDIRRTRRWVAQLAVGLDALHSMGVIHRDLKPENVLLDTRTNTVRIADFNAAYLQAGNAPLEDGAVYTRGYVGSRPYMAQEIVDRKWYGKMVDWWSLGCIMFDLTAGELLFRTDTQRTKFVTWDRKKEGMSYLSWATKLSEDEEAVLSGLLHLRPGCRFQLKQLRQQPYFQDKQGYVYLPFSLFVRIADAPIFVQGECECECV